MKDPAKYLAESGYLASPTDCPLCGAAGMSLLKRRNRNPEWWCCSPEGCAARVTMSEAFGHVGWPKLPFEKVAALFWAFANCFSSSQAAILAGVSEQPAVALHGVLRRIVAADVVERMKGTKLGGDVELDETTVRSTYLRNEKDIAVSQDCLYSMFTGPAHVYARWIILIGRGGHDVVMRELPDAAIRPHEDGKAGGAPSLSAAELEFCGILDHLAPGSFVVFTDSASSYVEKFKAPEAAGAQNGARGVKRQTPAGSEGPSAPPHAAVNHNKDEFSKRVRLDIGGKYKRRRVAGTQCADHYHGMLKHSVFLNCVKATDRDRIREGVYAFTWFYVQGLADDGRGPWEAVGDCVRRWRGRMDDAPSLRFADAVTDLPGYFAAAERQKKKAQRRTKKRKGKEAGEFRQKLLEKGLGARGIEGEALPQVISQHAPEAHNKSEKARGRESAARKPPRQVAKSRAERLQRRRELYAARAKKRRG